MLFSEASDYDNYEANAALNWSKQSAVGQERKLAHMSKWFFRWLLNSKTRRRYRYGAANLADTGDFLK